MDATHKKNSSQARYILVAITFQTAQNMVRVNDANATKEGNGVSLLLPLLDSRLLLLATCRRDRRLLGLGLVVGGGRIGLLRRLWERKSASLKGGTTGKRCIPW